MMVFHAYLFSIYCSLLFALRATGALGLVVHHVSGPYVFDHVPASFGFSHALTERLVTIAQPDHGCPGMANQQPSSYAGASNASTKLLQPDHGGKVLIIQRGQCNFTEKIMWAQAGNAAVRSRTAQLPNRGTVAPSPSAFIASGGHCPGRGTSRGEPLGGHHVFRVCLPP